MKFLDGNSVETTTDWEKRKKEILNLWCEYYIGHYPEKAPGLLSSEVTNTENIEDGTTRKRIRLTFDTPNKKSFEIEVWEPSELGKAARPLFLTQPREYQVQWAEEAVKRGYIACLYPGLDAHHNDKDYPDYQNVWKVFKDEYPDAGWASSLGIQAWLASRALDFFLDKKSGYNINVSAIGIAGHSRYGKQSIYAAAFDDRFKTVIARSSGTPTGCSYRFASRQTFMESVSDDDCPKAWVLDNLSDFYGRENELPVEGNALMAAIAPRNLMIHTAYNDGSDPTFGVERNYLNAKKAYEFLGAGNNIHLSYRTGQHNPITEAHTRLMFDYFDMSFGRGTATIEDFPEVLNHQFDFEAWKSKQRKQDLNLPDNLSVEEKIKWMLGEKPDNLYKEEKYRLKTEDELGVPAWSRDRWNPGGLKRVPFAFAGDMNGNMYFDPNLSAYKGTVIWLHPWNYSHGSNEGYGVQGTTIYWRLAQEGYIVVGYDQFGFGDQLTSAFGFYEKYPQWSLLGRAVSDVSNVIDYLVDGKGIAAEKVPETDPSKIYICGFSYGGMVGLYASALDERIAGVASFSGFTPMRTDTDKKPTGGIRRLWEWHHVLPKLGLYNGNETGIPYDYEDVIKLISPRKVLIYAPENDRFADPGDISKCIEKAQEAWENKSGLIFKNPDDICRFQKDQQDELLDWLSAGLASNIQANEAGIPALEDCNVTWDSPSKNSLGSMPAGNGDIGINLWVEENGDLLFYLSKTDAWSENARLLKLGKIRLSLSPNPFKEGSLFTQELVLRDGVIHIEAGKPDEKVSIDVWVDANRPVVEIDVKSQKMISASVSTEPWRLERREIADKAEIHSAYGLQSVVVEKDTIIECDDENAIWAHRNERSIWKNNLTMQGLEGYIEKGKDPLLHNTFGGLIHSDHLKKTSQAKLESKDPVSEFSISVFALTAQTQSLDEWKEMINKIAGEVTSESREDRLKAHTEWWQSFWDRSHVFVSTQNEQEKDKVANVSRNYNLQRYMNACSGRGNSPIKFNGSIFTVDTKDLQGKNQGFDADYRQWGGPYWWQNTRLPYWSMLESGDFDLMLPLFKMYQDALEIRKFSTKKYYGHDGAFFPETMRHWGTYVESNYGEDRSGLPLGMTKNRYIRYYWQGGLELSLMMLDYYSFTQDVDYLRESIIPFVKEIVTFFDQHWQRDKNGKILFDPAMALETYNTAVNPLPEIVGINKVCSELLNLPANLISENDRKQFSRLINELPQIPMQEVDGEQVLAPAYEYSGKQNIENPELYAIFPYRRFGLGKDSLELAIRTFDKRLIKYTGGWQQNAIKAAYLGLVEEASSLTVQNFNTSNDQFRFPAMWGPNYDWIPDQDHGSVAMIALQRMLLQYEGDEIILFPAWPKDWDVDFKLHAPKNTIIEGNLKSGEKIHLKVTPVEREKDIVLKYNIGEK
jgi:pimeloyl-ACP methyl ester carboxylesterase